MQSSSVNILCTAVVDDSFIDEARRDGILIDVIPFIEVKLRKPEEIKNLVQQHIKSRYWVFTSANAVKAVAENINKKILAKIYCVGDHTSECVRRYFGADSIEGVADNAAELADRIISSGKTSELIFYCGNARRDELRERLTKHEIIVKEAVVYETISLDARVNKSYNGILFFSPSAVKNFFHQNEVGQETVLFAIGDTTAAELRAHSANTIIKAESQSKNNLLDQAVCYFRDRKRQPRTLNPEF